LYLKIILAALLLCATPCLASEPSDPASIPALAKVKASGAQLTDLGVNHGLRSVFARSGQHFQVFYITPDGQGIIGGVMWDSSGENLTRKLVADIDGVIPTVTLDRTPADDGALKAVSKASYGLVGKEGAPRLWMLFDPQCSFSIRAMQQLQPFVEQGKVQLALIPVSILDHEDSGRSTDSALGLLSQPAENMAAAWMAGKPTGVRRDDAERLLSANMKIADQIHLRGTPTFLWETKNRSAGRLDGVPSDFGMLTTQVGG